MKKRIRKKLHVGEFKQYGNVIIINTHGDEETAEIGIFLYVSADYSNHNNGNIFRCIATFWCA